LISDKIILGIDPGTQIMGYGIIHKKNKELKMINMGVVKLTSIQDHYEKLSKIYERTISLIDEYYIDELSIEAPFYGKNVQSMLKLGRAQGVVMAAAISKSVPVFEYSPRKIKQSITGKGSASKEQVLGMLQSILKIHEAPEYLDASDGLAVAMCHYLQGNKQNKEGHYSGWKQFIKNNPERLK